MPTLIQATVTLESLSGFPADDNVQNVLHIASNGDDTSGPSLTAAALAVVNFFLDPPATFVESVGQHISASMSRGTDDCTVEIRAKGNYDFPSPFGSPLLTDNFTLPAALGPVDMPTEVASVVSYNADLSGVPVSQTNPTPPPATIRPAQRRRGRMYVGPLSSDTGEVVDGQFRPSGDWRQLVGASFAEMATEINAVSDYQLVVWSRADQDVYPVLEGFVDNAYDIQRRRGVDPTIRTGFVV